MKTPYDTFTDHLWSKLGIQKSAAINAPAQQAAINAPAQQMNADAIKEEEEAKKDQENLLTLANTVKDDQVALQRAQEDVQRKADFKNKMKSLNNNPATANTNVPGGGIARPTNYGQDMMAGYTGQPGPAETTDPKAPSTQSGAHPGSRPEQYAAHLMPVQTVASHSAGVLNHDATGKAVTVPSLHSATKDKGTAKKQKDNKDQKARAYYQDEKDKLHKQANYITRGETRMNPLLQAGVELVLEKEAAELHKEAGIGLLADRIRVGAAALGISKQAESALGVHSAHKSVNTTPSSNSSDGMEERNLNYGKGTVDTDYEGKSEGEKAAIKSTPTGVTVKSSGKNETTETTGIPDVRINQNGGETKEAALNFLRKSASRGSVRDVLARHLG